MRLERRQDEVRDVAGIAASGPPHSHTQAKEVGASEHLGDRTEPVVSGEPAACAGLEPPELQVDLVVDDEHVLDRNLEEAGGGRDRATGLVHVRLGLQERDAMPVEPRLARAGR